jgi:putative oxidoreductase
MLKKWKDNKGDPMSKIQLAARIILGLIYSVFGAMGLAIVFGFMKMPQTPMPEAAETYMKGIMAAGYFFPLLKITETTCGLLILTGIAAPLALVIIAPVTLNIFLFHKFLTPGMGNLILPSIMVVMQILAMSGYWNVYQRLFSKK